MRANIFRDKNKIGLEEKPIPNAGPGEAVVRVTLTTICGTDVHIMRGEYPVRQGQTIGHEPVGVIHELGDGVTGYEVGERVAINAITPCGMCEYCLSANWAQCGGYLGGWKMGNTIDGCQADYVKIPSAMANLARIPDELSDEDVLLTTDIFSTGLSGAESADVQVGDMVVVFGQGPIGLGATAAGLAFMVFVLLYTPCMAAIAAERHELGGRWAALTLVGQLAIAWVVAFLVFRAGAWLGGG